MRGGAENVSMNLYVQKRTDAVGRLWWAFKRCIV